MHPVVGSSGSLLGFGMHSLFYAAFIVASNK